MLAENFAEQGGGRRNTDVFRGRQRSYAEFYATDVKVFYLIIVSDKTKPRADRFGDNCLLLLEVQVKESNTADAGEEGLCLVPCAVADIEAQYSVLNSRAVLVKDV